MSILEKPSVCDPENCEHLHQERFRKRNTTYLDPQLGAELIGACEMARSANNVVLLVDLLKLRASLLHRYE